MLQGVTMEKKSFPCYLDYRKPLALLTTEECGKLFLAMLDYAESGAVPDFEGTLAMAFAFIRNQIDRDAVAYAERCKKNAANGRKGGRPPKQPPSISDEPFDPNKNPYEDIV